MSVTMVSTSAPVGEMKWNLIMDKRGEVAGVRVERAMGIQGRPLSLQSAQKLKDTS